MPVLDLSPELKYSKSVHLDVIHASGQMLAKVNHQSIYILFPTFLPKNYA